MKLGTLLCPFDFFRTAALSALVDKRSIIADIVLPSREGYECEAETEAEIITFFQSLQLSEDYCDSSVALYGFRPYDPSFTSTRHRNSL